MDAICAAAWEEVRELEFSSFAVRAKRSDKTFRTRAKPSSGSGCASGGASGEAGRSVKVRLKNPEITCYVEITPRPTLVYARRVEGAGGLPANTAGRMMCLLSGGFDSRWRRFR